MGIIQKTVDLVNHLLWDYILVFALVGIGIIFTFYLGFIQIKKLGKGFKNTFREAFRKDRKQGEISSFQALSVAIAAQVGTGNVAGVATAIGSGGPGAIFWMWLSAFFGMSTIFVEAVLAQKYRDKEDGKYIGGPAYYIRKGLGRRFGGEKTPWIRFLAAFFSVSIILALGLIGNMTQSHSISTVVSSAFNIPALLIGILVAIFAALIFIGGIKRIANFAQLVVPFMAIIYIVCGIIILFQFHDRIIPTLELIIKSAFSTKALAGGALGITMKEVIRYGVARGLFSNEAGMGSTPHAHATALVSHPVEQGMTAMVGVFVDTFVVCTFTALMILITNSQELGLQGAAVTQEAFAMTFGHIGRILLAICLTFFAFTTIIGWYYFAESNILSLFGRKLLRPFQILVMVAIIRGSIIEADLVWDLSDMFNGIMVIPNLIALVLLMGEAKEILKDYDEKSLTHNISYDYEN